MVACSLVSGTGEVRDRRSGTYRRDYRRGPWHSRDPTLVRSYGLGRWRKQKGIATVRWPDAVRVAEVHWYEAHGMGRKEMKIKRLLGGDA